MTDIKADGWNLTSSSRWKSCFSSRLINLISPQWPLVFWRSLVQIFASMWDSSGPCGFLSWKEMLFCVNLWLYIVCMCDCGRVVIFLSVSAPWLTDSLPIMSPTSSPLTAVIGSRKGSTDNKYPWVDGSPLNFIISLFSWFCWPLTSRWVCIPLPSCWTFLLHTCVLVCVSQPFLLFTVLTQFLFVSQRWCRADRSGCLTVVAPPFSLPTKSGSRNICSWLYQ